jgi:hypothetical protein
VASRDYVYGHDLVWRFFCCCALTEYVLVWTVDLVIPRIRLGMAIRTALVESHDVRECKGVVQYTLEIIRTAGKGLDASRTGPLQLNAGVRQCVIGRLGRAPPLVNGLSIALPGQIHKHTLGSFDPQQVSCGLMQLFAVIHHHCRRLPHAHCPP